MKQTTENKGERSTSTKQIFNDIDDLPLWNFKKVIETKELTFLQRDENSKATQEELSNAWNQISEQVAAVSGVDDLQQKYIMLQVDIENLTIDYLINRDASLITLIKTKQRELKKLMDRFEGNTNFDEQIAAVELAFKFQIDDRKTTVKRFFTYVNFLRKQDNGRR